MSIGGHGCCRMYRLVYYSGSSPLPPSSQSILSHALPLTWPGLLSQEEGAKMPAPAVTDWFVYLLSSNKKGLTHRSVSTRCYHVVKMLCKAST